MRRAAPILVILVVAAAVRIGYLVQLSDDPFFAHPVIDARDNVADARYLREQSWLGPPLPYWKPPLYAYVLAVEQAAGGDGPWVPRLVQLVMDLGSCLLVFSIGKRLFSRELGLAAAGVVALAGPLIYFTGELVSASLVVLLDLALIRAAIWAWDDEAAGSWAVVGVLAGLAALARAEALIFVLLLAGLVLARRLPWRQRAAHACALAGGALLFVAPVTIRNAVTGNDAVLISANGGINLYIGAAPEYGGMIGVRPGHVWEKLVREPESVGIDRIGSRHSRWFVRAAVRRMLAEPGVAAQHAARKAALFWHGHELMSNRDLYETRRTSWVLRALLWSAPPFYLPFGLLAPLALVGMAIAARRRHEAWPLLLFVAAVMASSVTFFATSRFRAPVLPVLALFAVFAVDEMLALRRLRDWRALAASAVAVLLLAGAINWPGAFAASRADYRRQADAEERHYRGTVLLEERRFADAAVLLEEAMRLEPHRASTAHNLAQAYAGAGQHEQAYAAIIETLRIIDDDSPGERYFEMDSRLLLQALVQVAPGLAGARCYLEAEWDCAIATLPPSAGPLRARALFERATLRLDAHDDAGANADLAAARALRPSDALTMLLSAVAAARTGQDDEARAFVTTFREVEWPRGSFYRAVVRPKRPVPLEREALELILRFFPDEKLARQASNLLSRAQ